MFINFIYLLTVYLKCAGFIKQNFTDRSKEVIIPLYKSLVRPHLEYCYQIWNPNYSKDTDLVEAWKACNIETKACNVEL